jgi:hypothetical protein
MDKKSLFFLAMAVFAANIGWAEAESRKGGGSGYFMVGINSIDLDSLNSRLKAKGYSELSDTFTFVGGGGHGIVGKVIVGGGGGRLMGDEVSSKGYRMSLDGGYGLFNVGYIVHSKENLKIYPLIGIGGGGISLEIVEEGTSPPFDDILDDPKRGAELTASGFLFQIGVGADYFIEIGGDERGRGGLGIGLFGGYILSPGWNWKMDGTDLSDSPDMSITGPYIHLTIAGVGLEK